MSEINLKTADFENEVLKAEVPVLIDFWAEWCGPCQMIGPIIEELAGEIEGAKIFKVNVDQEPELAEKYGVMSIPTFIIFKNGEIKEQFSGALPKDLIKEKIEQAKA